MLFYQKFDSMRVKRVHRNERKVREKDRNYKELLSLFSSFFSFPHPPPPTLHLPSINPAWFLFPYMCLRISKEKREGLWTGYQSLGMHRKQNFKLVFGFKNDLASPSTFFHFSCLIVFLLLCIWLHFGGKRYLGKLSWSCDYVVHSLFQALK